MKKNLSPPILVSACLAGQHCRYDGDHRSREEIQDLVKQGLALPVCPEQMGGLPTPRDPAEQKKDQVFTVNGEDVTLQYKKGAQEALELALLAGCEKAWLKSKSPMCGSGRIYDGSFTGTMKQGEGIFAQLLKGNGINVEAVD